ncbi:MAG TPA: HAD-IA family hydrolase [Nocardioidaceae bacterium]|jgi:beta-phosphoglucomutase-like phosphatase (HAD superfamily)|nr:HAD-IA family hydrolase [Nocardioidaceae bacterium]
MQAGFRGAIFDVDGVLVDSPHERAWRDTLHELMETRWSDIRPSSGYAPDRFTSRVYQDVVSGKPRLSGARAVLEHFEVPDAASRAAVYAERKQERVVKLIEAGEFKPFQDALRFVLAVAGLGLRIAAASSSKNAGLMLAQIMVDDSGRRLCDLFAADLSGGDFTRGKPDPEIFLAAGEALGLAPADCFVVEDAVAGVEAAKAGGMAALGVARADDAHLLEAAGADLVVTTLDDVDLDRLAEGRLAILPGSPG